MSKRNQQPQRGLPNTEDRIVPTRSNGLHSTAQVELVVVNAPADEVACPAPRRARGPQSMAWITSSTVLNLRRPSVR